MAESFSREALYRTSPRRTSSFPPGIPVPFVAAVVDCDGTSVRANVINVDPDPAHLSLGMKVRLATYPLGTDSAGTEAVGFGFEPISN